MPPRKKAILSHFPRGSKCEVSLISMLVVGSAHHCRFTHSCVFKATRRCV